MQDSDKNNFDQRGGELMPRELMERAADPAIVPDEALVAVLLKTGAHGLNVIELSRRLIEAFGSMKSLVSADWRALEERIKGWNATHPDRPIKGLGHVKCLELSAAFEMGRRWSRLAPDELKAYKVTDPATAYRIFKTVLTPGDDKENLYALLLNRKNCPICEPLRISRGTADSAPAFARDVFKEALKWGAVAVMVAHNHPSGDPTPGKADFKFTERLVELAKIAEIRLLDHLVLGDGNYTSIRSLDAISFD
ncbi:MAG: RadC family protein [Kiritimatiellia bacterium]